MNKKGRPVKDLEIDPREGEIVREIFFKVAREGYSAHGIARMLNERNIVTPVSYTHLRHAIDAVIRFPAFLSINNF